MARLPYLTDEDLPEGYRDLFSHVQNVQSVTTNLVRVLAHSPEVLVNRFKYSTSLRRDISLAPRYRELAILTVGYLTDSKYEIYHHLKQALRAGVPAEAIDSILEFEHSPHFDERDRAVMRFAKELTLSVSTSDATWSSLASFLRSKELIELALIVGWYNQTVRILAALQIDIEAD